MVEAMYRLVIAWLVLWPVVAHADFRDIRRVTSGTAYTYERGEFSVGVLRPIEYGVLDELTLTAHPVLYLLLTPNVAAKWKWLDLGGVAASLSACYIQTFLNRDLFPGAAAFFPSLTVPILGRVSVTVQGGYLMDLGPIRHGATFGGSIAGLVTGADLLQVMVQEEWRSGPSIFERPTVLLAYTHAFFSLRLTAGVAFGRFPIQVGSSSASVKEWPAFPVIDVWWLL